MTTPQDIQDALDGMPNLYGDVTQRPQPQLARWYDRHFKTIRHVLQSHAPAHDAGDLEKLKRDYKTDRTGMSYEQIKGWNDCIDHLAPRLARSVPEKLDDDLKFILGRPNFACISEAEMLRNEGWDIPHKAEQEQAAVIFWMLNLYLKHGPDKWRDGAADFVQAHIDKVTAAPQQKQGKE